MKGTERKYTYNQEEVIRRARKANRKNIRRAEVMRGRFLIVMTVLGIMLTIFYFTQKGKSYAIASDSNEEALYKYYTTITIEENQTLWDIAKENTSSRYYDSVQEYIDEVKAINGLENDTIHEGAKLVIVYFSHEYK